jgi:hypothetical protein
MRINELEKEIDSLVRIYDIGLRVRQTTKYIFIDRFEPENLYTIAQVGLDEEYIINTDDSMFNRLPKEFKKELFNILVEFVRTPVGERVEEKKYQYRLKEKYLWISNRGSISNNFLNLNYGESKPYIILNDKGQVIGYKTIFTDEEIQEVVDKFNVNLEMFDKIEVE